MDHAVAGKIRKLLRLAKLGGPEGAIAHERADHLMQRHGIHVTLNDTVRIPIPNAAKVFWREQLLIAVARTHACKVQSSTNEKAPMAVLVGERPLIDDAHELYLRLCTELLMKCSASWCRFAPVLDGRGYYEDEDEDEDRDEDEDYGRRESVGDDGWSEIIGENIRGMRGSRRVPDFSNEILGEMLGRSPGFAAFVDKRRQQPEKSRESSAVLVARDNPEVAAAYFRVYLNNAAVAAGRKLGTGPKVPVQAALPPELNMPRRQKVIETKPEETQIAEGLEKLVKLIGAERVRQLQGDAEYRGNGAGSNAYVVPRSRKMLTADGSIPKPEPSRFMYLDLD
jgi:hypothetical protein